MKSNNKKQNNYSLIQNQSQNSEKLRPINQKKPNGKKKTASKQESVKKVNYLIEKRLTKRERGWVYTKKLLLKIGRPCERAQIVEEGKKTYPVLWSCFVDTYSNIKMANRLFGKVLIPSNIKKHGIIHINKQYSLKEYPKKHLTGSDRIALKNDKKIGNGNENRDNDNKKNENEIMVNNLKLEKTNNKRQLIGLDNNKKKNEMEMDMEEDDLIVIPKLIKNKQNNKQDQNKKNNFIFEKNENENENGNENERGRVNEKEKEKENQNEIIIENENENENENINKKQNQLLKQNQKLDQKKNMSKNSNHLIKSKNNKQILKMQNKFERIYNNSLSKIRKRKKKNISRRKRVYQTRTKQSKKFKQNHKQNHIWNHHKRKKREMKHRLKKSYHKFKWRQRKKKPPFINLEKCVLVYSDDDYFVFEELTQEDLAISALRKLSQLNLHPITLKKINDQINKGNQKVIEIVNGINAFNYQIYFEILKTMIS
ncbi:RNA polymerase iii transcription initiation factor b [Anaeramoeba flamelloides]|uniref:RNA polymerase iii transcription initiation factor b n=1 Tax=Anaeramoeba flamelloides TaxID=1746091 RepID=A0ABQ8X6K4_9EUKA|nr:RNA polymerase iii transcription initiation factor b [Anaeramoeba flamelloides]